MHAFSYIPSYRSQWVTDCGCSFSIENSSLCAISILPDLSTYINVQVPLFGNAVSPRLLSAEICIFRRLRTGLSKARGLPSGFWGWLGC